MYFTEAGKLRSLPASWTSVADEDGFQGASAGRSWFRLDDLLELSALVATIQQLRRKGVK
jgi:hypothetical protein